MSETTGPVVAIGAITLANNVLLNGKPFAWKVPIATAVAAGGFALVEKAAPKFAVVLAWTALATILLTRTDPKVPSPVESISTWWSKQ